MKKLINFLLKNQSLKQTVIKNTFWLTTGHVLGRAIRSLLVIYAARVLGAEGYGVFSYALGLAGLVMGFSDIGLTAILQRELAKGIERQKRIIATSLFLKTALTILTFSILGVIARMASISSARILIPFLGLSMLSDGFREFGFSITRAYQRMEIEAAITIFYQIISLLSGFFILSFWPTPFALSLAYAASGFIGTALLFYHLRLYFREFWRNFDRELLWMIGRDAWPFALMTFGSIFLLYTDTILIGWLKTESDVGYYSAAIKPIQLIGLIPALLTLALFPTIAQRGVLRETASVVSKGFSVLMLAAFPIAIGGILLSDSIVQLIFGSTFLPSASPFRILILTILVSFPSTIFGWALLAYNRQFEAVKYIMGSALLNVVLNYFLIPPLGINGAALATAIANIIYMLGLILEYRKIEKFPIFPNVWRPVIATAGMAATILILKILAIPPLFIFFAAALSYLLILIFLKEPILKEILFLRRSYLNLERA